MSRRICMSIALVCILAVPLVGRSDDWPQFRGPTVNGLTRETNLPAEWGAEKNVAWKIALPGVAWSQPIVVGDKIFVTTAITEKQAKPKPFSMGKGGFPKGDYPKGDFPKGGPPKDGAKGGFPGMGSGKPPDVMYQWEIHCLDRATGKSVWKKTAAEKKPSIATHGSNTYASETPVSDGERVYAYFGMTGLYCYDLAGKLVWERDLGSYKMMAGWGTGSSPALDGDRLFVLCDNEEQSFVVALDKKTGKDIWRKRRSDRSSWGTPYVWKTKDRTQIVCVGPNRACAYDPATGDIVWEMKGIDGGSASTPVANDEMIYLGTGGIFGVRPLVAVKADAKGDITLKDGQTSNEFVAWSHKMAGPYMSSALLYDGLLYVTTSQRGSSGVTCYDPKTGKKLYENEPLEKAGGITASPWAYDGKVFFLDENGRTFVLKAGKEFKVLAENKLNEMFWSSPAIAGGALFLRGTDHLFCIK